MRKLDTLLNGVENFFAGLRCSPFPDNATAAVVACRIAENEEGGWSIYLGEKRNIKIGNYANYERARHVAEDLNFFLVEDAQ